MVRWFVVWTLMGIAHGAFLSKQSNRKQRVLYVLHDNHTCQLVKISSGTLVEVLSSKPKCQANSPRLDGEPFTKKPPLIFLHGSFHASWSWSHYLTYFAEKGFSCYAFSFQGTGGTPARDGATRVKIMDHVSDLGAFIDYVYTEEQRTTHSNATPVVIAHSFAGLTVMKYLETVYLHKSNTPALSLSGIAMICSVPPSGNGKMTMRFLRRSLTDSWKITMGLAFKKCLHDDQLCRELFFGGKKKMKHCINDKGEKIIYEEDWGVSDEDLKRYQRYFVRDSVATIDLGDLVKNLPSYHVDSLGRATFSDRIPHTIVVGAKDDFIVDKEGVEETATYFGVNPIYVDSPHDIMLGRNHLECAKVINQWLENTVMN